MNIFVRILHITAGLFTAAVIIIGGVTAVPKLFGYLPCIILSGSMEPAIETGSIVYIDGKAAECQIGDIITYRLMTDRDRNTLVTHRIIGQRDGAYVTKGDANDTADTNLVSQEQIIGRFRFSIPRLGYLQSKITPKVGKVVTAWVLALNFAVWIVRCFAEEDTGEDAAVSTRKKKPESRKA